MSPGRGSCTALRRLSRRDSRPPRSRDRPSGSLKLSGRNASPSVMAGESILGGPGAVPRLHEPHAPEIAFRVGVRRENAQHDQLAQLLDADPGSVGRLRSGMRLHEPYCSGGAPSG